MNPQIDDPLTRRFPIVQLKPSSVLSDDQQLRMEHSLQAHPQLRHLSVLPETEFLTEQEILQRQTDLQNKALEARQKLPMAQLDLTREDRDQAIADLLNDRFSKNHGLTPEMQVLAAALQGSPDYAWAWACNIAMSFVDEGGEHAMANRAAARFLQMLAKADITQLPQYQQTQALDRYVFEDQVRVARDRNDVYRGYLEFYAMVATQQGVAPTPSNFPEVDRDRMEWPLAFRFGAPKNPGDRIVITYIAAGESVAKTLQTAEQAAQPVPEPA
jgi:hypothetical protein